MRKEIRITFPELLMIQDQDSVVQYKIPDGVRLSKMFRSFMALKSKYGFEFIISSPSLNQLFLEITDKEDVENSIEKSNSEVEIISNDTGPIKRSRNRSNQN